MNKTRLALALPFALATLAGMAATPASAQTVRWAAAGDALTMDPHAQNEGPTHVMNHQVYDSLVFRDQAMKLAPRLATSWKITDDPNVWEFKLREGVKYHNGNPFTADDVVFSILRAKHENSDMKGLLTSVVEVTKVDEHTVRMRTDGPNPLLPNNLTNLFIMDREWSEANKVTLPQNYKAGDETFAVRNANGTGPFMLASYYGRDAALVARVILLTTVGSVVTVSICLNLLANLAPV